MKSKNAGLEMKAPEATCNDVKCPYHGSLKLRGRSMNGRDIKKDKHHKYLYLFGTWYIKSGSFFPMLFCPHKLLKKIAASSFIICNFFVLSWYMTVLVLPFTLYLRVLSFLVELIIDAFVFINRL